MYTGVQADVKLRCLCGDVTSGKILHNLSLHEGFCIHGMRKLALKCFCIWNVLLFCILGSSGRIGSAVTRTLTAYLTRMHT